MNASMGPSDFYDITILAKACGHEGPVFFSPEIRKWCYERRGSHYSLSRASGLLLSIAWAMQQPNAEYSQLVRAKALGETVWVLVVTAMSDSRRHLYVYFPYEPAGRLSDPEIPF